MQDERLADLLALVLEIADGNYSARIESSDAGDSLDAVAVGLNLMADSLQLERAGRERAEALLRDKVQAYEEAPAMSCSLELRNFEIVKCDETMARAVGVDKDKLLRRRLLGFLPIHERATAKRSLRSIARGEPAEQTTFHLRGEGGRPIPVLVSGSRLEPDGTHSRLVLRDVTREHMLAARLRDAQQLEVVGRLASGVSHDFSNLLQVILGAAAMLQSSLADAHPGQRELEAIVGEADLGSGLTRQLLALSRPLPDREVPRSEFNEIVIVRLLESAGNDVVSADGLTMAVDLVRDAEPVDLVVSDLVMPGGSGVELARVLWRDRPALPVVFVSGYTGDEIERDVLDRPCVRFLGKPFRPAQLLELIEELRPDCSAPVASAP